MYMNEIVNIFFDLTIYDRNQTQKKSCLDICNLMSPPSKFFIFLMVSANLLFGGFLVLISLFLGALFTLTYCVMQSFEKETSELGAEEDAQIIAQPSTEQRIGVDGNPVLESDDEEFIF